MKKLRNLFLTLMGFLTLPFGFSCASSNSTEGSKTQHVNYLTEKTLDEATVIVLKTTSGALPPEYQWSDEIRVKPDSVSVLVSGAYDEEAHFHKTVAITSEQYAEFKQSLLDCRVGNITDELPPKCGGKTIYIAVYGNGGKLFFAANDNLRVENGHIFPVFRMVMDQEMNEALHD